MSGERWHMTLIQHNVGTCPSCGCDLDLYKRPINVRFLLCCGCENEYSETDDASIGVKQPTPPQADGSV